MVQSPFGTVQPLLFSNTHTHSPDDKRDPTMHWWDGSKRQTIASAASTIIIRKNPSTVGQYASIFYSSHHYNGLDSPLIKRFIRTYPHSSVKVHSHAFASETGKSRGVKRHRTTSCNFDFTVDFTRCKRRVTPSRFFFQLTAFTRADTLLMSSYFYRTWSRCARTGAWRAWPCG